MLIVLLIQDSRGIRFEFREVQTFQTVSKTQTTCFSVKFKNFQTEFFFWQFIWISPVCMFSNRFHEIWWYRSWADFDDPVTDSCRYCRLNNTQSEQELILNRAEEYAIYEASHSCLRLWSESPDAGTATKRKVTQMPKLTLFFSMSFSDCCKRSLCRRDCKQAHSHRWGKGESWTKQRNQPCTVYEQTEQEHNAIHISDTKQGSSEISFEWYRTDHHLVFIRDTSHKRLWHQITWVNTKASLLGEHGSWLGEPSAPAGLCTIRLEGVGNLVCSIGWRYKHHRCTPTDLQQTVVGAEVSGWWNQPKRNQMAETN